MPPCFLCLNHALHIRMYCITEASMIRPENDAMKKCLLVKPFSRPDYFWETCNISNSKVMCSEKSYSGKLSVTILQAFLAGSE